MRKLIVLLLFISNLAYAQVDIKSIIKKNLKFSTFYAAVNGGTSISDVETYSVTDGLGIETIQTPYDYNLTLGIRKMY